MPSISFHVPYSDMRWRNAKSDPPESSTMLLGLFLYWDSTNHTMFEVVKQCMVEADGEWSVITGYEDGPDGPCCHETQSCPPAYWAELQFRDGGDAASRAIHGNASLN